MPDKASMVQDLKGCSFQSLQKAMQLRLRRKPNAISSRKNRWGVWQVLHLFPFPFLSWSHDWGVIRRAHQAQRFERGAEPIGAHTSNISVAGDSDLTKSPKGRFGVWVSPHKLGPLLVDCSMLIHVGIGDGMIAHWYVRAHRNIDIYTCTLYAYTDT